MLGTYCFDSANHKGRAKDCHVEVIKLLDLLRIEESLNETVRDILSAFHPSVDVEDHATICLD